MKVGETRSDATTRNCRWATLLLALAMLLGISAQAAALVSNHGQEASPGKQIVDAEAYAQGFTTGPSPDGYFLNGVDLQFDRAPGLPSNFVVTLWSADSEGAGPAEPLHILGNPDDLSSAGVRTFKAAPETVLEPDTTYFVLFSYIRAGDEGTPVIEATAWNREDAGGLVGWRIADNRLTRVRGSSEDWEPHGESVKISLAGSEVTPLAVAPPEDEAAWSVTLTRREIAEAEGGAATLMVRTGGAIFATDQSIALAGAGTATAGDDYTVESGGKVLASPFELTLAAGATVVTAAVRAVNDAQVEGDEKVVLTASHGDTPIGEPQTLTISDAPVTGAAPATGAAARGVSTGTGALVSNHARETSPSDQIVNAKEYAQGFTTGPSADGYLLDGVDLQFKRAPGFPSNFVVTLWSADSVGVPDDPLYVLNNPGDLSTGGARTFRAPPGTVLEPDTTYFVHFSYTWVGGEQTPIVEATDEDREDAGSLEGWQIADGWLTRARGSSEVWVPYGESVKISLAGSEGSLPALVTPDGEPAWSVSVTRGEIAESDEVVATVMVRTGGAAFAQDQNIALAVAGTATAGDDYTVESGGTALTAPFRLTLAAGATSVLAAVRAVDDAQVEGDETVVLTASHGNAPLGEPLTVTITDAPVGGVAARDVSTQAAALVSNHGQEASPSGQIVNAKEYAQGFTTGPSPEGYSLTDIGLQLNRAPGTPSNFIVTLWSADSQTARPAERLHVLSNPGDLSTAGVRTFRAAPDTVLKPDTTYFVHFSYTWDGDEQTPIVEATADDREDADGLWGWRIADDWLSRTRGSPESWVPYRESVKISVNGSDVARPVAGAQDSVADGAPAWSVALVPDGITESDERAATLIVSTGGVAFPDDQHIELAAGGTAIAGDDYTVESGGAVLAAPYRLTLAAGATSVTATIRALNDAEEEGNETVVLTASRDGEPVGQPQTLTISEAPATITGAPVTDVAAGAAARDAAAQAVVLVSNHAQRASPSDQIVDAKAYVQGFTTGPSPDGYTLGGVDLQLNRAPGTPSNFVVTLWSADDSATGPSERLQVLSNPDDLSTAGLRTFSAAPGTLLQPNTTYFLHLFYTRTGNDLTPIVEETAWNREDEGSLAGWSIGDGWLSRTRGSLEPWASHSESIKISVSGSEVGRPSSAVRDSVADRVPAWSVALVPDDLAESDQAAATLVVSSGGVAFATDQSIALAVAGTATAGDDYTVESGGTTLAAPFLLTLNAGDTSVMAAIRAVSDAEVEGNETVVLAASHNGAPIGRQQTLTISEAPAAISEAPAAVSDAPAAISEAPTAISEAPTAISQAPAAISEAPAVVSEAPAAISEAPVPVISTPVTGVTRRDVSTQAPTLVSNSAQTDSPSDQTVNAEEYAQAFTTGPNPHGYILRTVGLLLNRAPGAPSNFIVTLWSADSLGARPAERLQVLSNPDDLLTAGLKTFNARPDTVLEPDTTYFLHVSYARSGDEQAPTIAATAWNREDAAGQEGWRIGDGWLSRARGSSEAWSSDIQSVKISVGGSEAPPPAPPAWRVAVDPRRIAEPEEGVATLTVRTDGTTFPEDQSIALELAGTATAGEDYTVESRGAALAAPFRLTLEAGATTVTAAIRAVNDGADEGNETILFTASHDGAPIGEPQTITISDSTRRLVFGVPVFIPLVAVGGAVGLLAVAGGTGSGGDGGTADTPPVVDVEDGEPGGVQVRRTSLAVREGGAGAAYTVVLTSQPLRDVTVTVGGVTDDIAVDLTRLTFTASSWNTPQTVSIQAVNDSIIEREERVTLTHAVSGYGSVTTANSVTVTVTDNDRPSWSVEAVPDQIPEAGGVATLTLSTGGATFTANQNIALTVSGTATVGDDYTVQSGGTVLSSPFVLTLEAGATSVTADIRAVNDTQRESSETVVFAARHNAALIGTQSVTLTDDDMFASTGVALGLNPDRVSEGAVATAVTVTATLDGGPRTAPTEVTVSISGGTATAGADYEAVAPFIITIAAGQQSGETTFTLTPIQEQIAEDAETLQLSGSAALPVDGVVLTLTDDDTPSTRVDLALNPVSVSEADGATLVTVTATLDAAALTRDTAVTVSVPGGTATAGADYGLVAPFVITIAAGQRNGQAFFTLVPNQDQIAEDDETLVVRGTAPGLTVNSAAVTITDDDGAGVRVRPTAVAVSEDGASGAYTVVLTSEPSGTVTVTVGGAGNDLTVSPSQLRFTASDWDTARTVSIRAVDDSISEGEEQVELTHAVSGYGSVTAADGVTVTVTDNDALTVSVAAVAQTVAEGTPAAFTVSVTDGRIAADVTVTYRVSGTATAGTDYTVPAGSLTIPGGTGSGTITIPTLTDSALDHGETLVVTLTAASTPARDVAVDSTAALMTIADASTVTVSVESNPVTEGDPALLTVSLSGPVTVAVTVNWSTSDLTTEAGSDYVPVTSGRLTFEPGAALMQTLEVQTQDDTLAEGDEAFAVTLEDTDFPQGVTLGTPTADVTITDDEELTVSVAAVAQNVVEGTPAAFTVFVTDGESTADVTVNYRVTGTATPGTDYTAPSGSLNIAAGEASGMITIPTLTDSVLDGGETLVVTLTAANTPAGSVTADTTEAETMIADEGTVTVSVTSDGAVVEGSPAMLTVSLSETVSDAVSVNWSTSDGSAEAGSDYTAVTTRTLTFQPGGPLTQTLVVPTQDDNLAEGDETFTVALTAPALPQGVALGTATARVTITDNEALTVSVAAVAQTVVEGAEAAFTVNVAGGGSTAPVTVSYRVSGTATSGTDYTGLSGILIIPAGGSSATINIETLTDMVLDPGESVEVELTRAITTLGTVTADPAAAQTTLSDAGAVTVSVAGSPVTEGGLARLTLSLSGAVSTPVTVAWSTSDNSTAAGSDYLAVASRTATFAAGSTQDQTLTVITLQDTLAEGDETFTVTLEAPDGLPQGVTLGTATADVTITDDEELTVSVAAVAQTVVEGAEAAFTVSVEDGQSTADVTVSYQVSGTAAPVTDYTAPSGSLTIPAGEGSGTISIPTLTDTVLDGGETLVVELTGASTTLGTIMADATSAETVIADGGTETVSVSSDGAVAEGTAAEFTVTLSGAVSSAVTVNWSTSDGTAEAASDYTAVTSTALTFQPGGSLSQTLTVPTQADDLAEGDETFTVTLTATNLPQGVALGTATAQATLTDDEALTVSVAADATAVDEGSPATFTVTVSGGQSTADVMVAYQVTGTATSGPDYTAPQGSLTIPAGVASGTISIQTSTDMVLDPDETLVVTLARASTRLGTAMTGTATTAQTTISDTGSVTVSVAAGSAVAEGTAARLTVSLSGAVSTPVEVTWLTADGTAEAGTDYTAVTSATLTFQPGAALTKTLTVQTHDDTLAEGGEMFTVTLEAPDGLPQGVTLDMATADVTLTDDEELTVSVAEVAQTVVEGTAAAFTVSVEDGQSTAAVTVTYQVSGTATSGTDYTAPSGSLTISAGEGSGTISIPTLLDDVLDGDETLVVTLTTASTALGTIMADTMPAQTVIADGDTETVSVEVDSAVIEGTDVSFTVTLSGPVSSAVTVNWSTSDGTAKSASDYTAVTAGTLTFQPDAALSQILTVQTQDDDLAEGDETFAVTLTAPSLPQGVALGTATAQATLTDDEALTVSVTADTATVAEGSAAAFTVTVEGGKSTAEVTVAYQVTGTATSGTDYTAPSGSLTIPTGEVSRTITIQTNEDTVLDHGETMVVTLTGASTTLGLVTADSTTAETAITDDGMVTVMVDADGPVDEGGLAMFTVSLSGAVSTPVEVTWSTADGTAVAGLDYAAVTSASLTFQPGASLTRTLTVQTHDDTLAEDDETFTVTLTAVPDDLPQGVTLGTAAAEVTITDDEELTVAVVGAQTAAEGTPATFTVSVGGGESTADVMVSYTVTGTATPATDYTAPMGNLTINAGEASGTISIPTLTDSVLDGGETLVVTLTAATTTPGTIMVDMTPAETVIADGDTVTVSVEAGNAVTEGTAAMFTVSLSGAVSSQVTVNWSTSDGTAKSASDYTAVTSTALTFQPDAALSQTLTVPTRDDTLAEGDETFTVTLTAPNLPQGVALGTATAQATLNDDEELRVTVAADAATVDEGSQATFTVTVADGQSTAPVTVAYRVTGTATSGADYTAPPGSLTIPAGEANGTITIETSTDMVLDADETLEVTLTDASTTLGTVTADTATSAAMTITDDSMVTVMVESDGPVAEGGLATLTVSLSGAVSTPVEVTWSTSDGTAKAGSDYLAVASSTVTFAAGSRQEQTLSVTTLQDTLAEGDETFTVTLTGSNLPDGVTITTPAADMTITDDEALTVTVVAGAETVAEGSPATFTVSVGGGQSTADVMVSYEVSGTATSGTDYTAPPGNLTINAGEASGIISIPTSMDAVLDGGETLVVMLTGATTTPGTIMADMTAAETVIADGDTVTVSVEAGAAVTEGTAATFTVTLSGAVSSAVEVNWSTSDGTAKSPSDYTAVTSTALTFQPGEALSQMLTVPTEDDDLVEGDETFTVTLAASNLPQGVALGTATAQATLTDDEALTVSVAADAVTVAEGSAAAFMVTVAGGESTAPVTVTYQVTGTATSGADYIAPSGSLTINAGDVSGTITIETSTDMVLDPDETLVVTLTGASTTLGTVMADTATAETTISDDGMVTVMVGSDGSVDEGGLATLTVSLSGAVSTPVEVMWSTANGTAEAGLDYAAVTSVTLTFQPGASLTKTLTVQTHDDTLAEVDETFTVALTAVPEDLPQGVTLGTETVEVTINDDEELTVTVAGAQTVAEGSPATFTVSVEGGQSTAEITVTYRVTGTATAVTDYTEPSGSLILLAGEASDTISIPTSTDTVLDGGETLVVELTDATTSAGSVTADTEEAETVIADAGTVTVAVAAGDAVTEGTPATFTVTLSGAVASPVAVSWSTSDGTAEAGSDYTAVASTALTFEPNQALTQTLTVQTQGDTLAEGDETFTVTLTATDLPPGVALGTATAQATLTDDEDLMVSVAADAGTVAEGSEATFTVTVADGQSTAPVTVAYRVTGTATSGADYTAPSGSLTIPTGEASGTVTIETTTDRVLDPDETLVVTLTGASTTLGTVTANTTDTAETTITDDGMVTVMVESDGSVAEGGLAMLTVSLSGAVSTPVEVTWSTSDVTTEAGSDYVAVTSRTVTFAAGSTQAQMLAVTTLQDTLAEGDETFTVTLTAVPDGLPQGVTIGTPTADVTITDDEALTVTVAASAQTVAEGSAATFTVSVGGGQSTTDVMVSYEVTGTATLDTDYTAPSGSLTINAGQGSGTISIETLRDTVLDGDETLVVTLTAATTSAGSVTAEMTAAETVIADGGTETVSVEAGAAVTEGTAATFTVTLSGAVSTPVEVNWSTADGTAKSASDYTAVLSTALTFQPGESLSQTLTVQTRADNLAEGDETFTVTLTATNLPQGVALGTATAQATLNDDEALTVSVAADATAVDEGSPADFTVTVAAGESTAAVTVTYQVTGTATSGADYTAPSGSLIIPAGHARGTITVQTSEDMVLDGDETLVVTLTSASTTLGTVTADTSTTATTTISDTTSVTVAIVAGDAVTEGTDATFTVTLSGAVATAVTVNWATSDNAAEAGSDYTAVASTALTFEPGESLSQTLTVTTLDDTLAEGDEAFTVTLTRSNLPDGVTIDTATAQATITDNDPVTVSVAWQGSVTEGGPATFTLRLSGAADNPVTVNWSTSNGTAESGADYTPVLSTAVTFAAGSTQAQTLSVTTLQDTLAEGNETFTVTLTASDLPGGVSLGTASATATITDDEALTVSVAADAVTVAEGSSATFTVTVADGQSTADVTVNYQVSGTATLDTDYTAPTGSLTINAGETSGKISIQTTEDTVLDPGETLVVTLTGASTSLGTVTANTATTAETTISDAKGVAVSVVAGNAVTEGTDATFTVTLSGAVATAVTVNWATSDDTAEAPSDYTAVASTALTFEPGERLSQTLTVTTLDDTLAEGDETFTVTLTGSNLPDGVTIGPATAQATLTDNDAAMVSVAWQGSVTEGGTTEFTVTLSGAAGNPVTVNWSTSNGTALAASDYAAVASTAVTFAAGSTQAQTLSVTTLQDTLAEGDETFTVTLVASDLPGGVSLGTASATATITDDEALTVSVAADAATVDEGSPAAFTVTVAGGQSTAGVMVTYEVSGTATSGTDYTAPDGTLTINAGDTSGTISIQTSEDTVLDPGETLVVTLTGASTTLGTVTADTTTTATTTISDTDGVTVSVAAGNAVTEGTDATFTVTLSGAVATAVTVNWATSDDTAEASSDYTAVASTALTFEPGESLSQTLTVTTLDDTLAEGDETFTVTLTGSNLPDGVTITTATAQSTITDDDAATVSVAWQGPLTEGGTATFTVTLSGAAASPVTVNWSTSNGTADSGADYTAVASTAVTFAAGSTQAQTLSVVTLQDNTAEGGETFTVSLAAPVLPGGVSLGTASAEATITDDDAASTRIDLGLSPDGVTEVAAATSITVTATLDAGAQPAATVVTVSVWETGDTATEDVDFTAVNDVTLTIAAGQQSGTTTFTLTPTLDMIAEGAETLTVSGTVTTGSVLPVTSATLTVADVIDVNWSMEVNQEEIAENGGTATLTVKTTDGTTFTTNQVIALDLSGGTATPESDFTLADSGGTTLTSPYQLTLQAGNDSVTATITGKDDLVGEAGERISIAARHNHTQIGTLTIRIDDDETTTILDSGDRKPCRERPLASRVQINGRKVTLVFNQDLGTGTQAVVDPYAAYFHFEIHTEGPPELITQERTDEDPDYYAQTYSRQGRQVELTINHVVAPGETIWIVYLRFGIYAPLYNVGNENPVCAFVVRAENLTKGHFTVADGRAGETDGALDFVVTLEPAATETVTVDYTTADGTGALPAHAGRDYTATSNRLTFVSGESAKTVSVPIIDDTVDDGGESFTLTLSNANNAAGYWITDDQATGTIDNTDPLPKAWTARFGRTVASNVVDALEARLDAASQTYVQLGGHRLGGVTGVGGTAWRLAPRREPWEPGAAESVRADMTTRQLLLGSAFHLVSNDDDTGGGPRLTAWGRVAGSRFDGNDSGMSLDGTVTTTTLGVDGVWKRWLTGVALAYSTGDGSFDHVDSGDLASDLTSVHPYASYALSDRVRLWGMAGYGSGEFRLGGPHDLRTDLEMTMAASGIRGSLMEPSPGNRLSLVVRSDVLWVRMNTERVSGMAATEAEVSRLRLVLEGSRAILMAANGILTPSIEVGLRHDDGDAETGSGVEVGGSLRFDSATGLSFEASVRGLLGHDAGDYREWGASAALRFDPGARGRGLTASVVPAWGAAATAASDLWRHPYGLGPALDNRLTSVSGRLDAELGYGLAALKGQGLLTPYARTALLEGADRSWHLGTRLTLRDSLNLAVEASHRQRQGAATAHELALRATMGW